ncbi:MAG: glycoside hydrolase family 31 protein [Cyclobacteriaceae bacterium]
MVSRESEVCRSIDSVKEIVINEYGMEARTGWAHIRLQTYSRQIVRVTATRHQSFDDFSYSVVAQPSANARVVEQPDHIRLEAGDLQVRMQRNPVRISFHDGSGKVINEDEAGLGTSWIGEQVTTYKKLQDGERFIGLGEKTGPLNRKGFAYQNWNTDAYAYHSGADPLYCSVPFYIGLHHGLCYGIFLDNTHKSHFNFGASNNRFASFSVDAGDLNYYFISGKNVSEVIRNYCYLTGTTPLPPKWSIGYQQCRYSYYPDKEVLNVARTFREKEIPADVIVFDIHYMEKYKIFTWDRNKFSNPKQLMDQLREMGFHVVVMCDPGIKVEEGYDTYDDGVKNDVFLKYSDGGYYTGQVWPGWCHFPDFTKPSTRHWWREKFHGYIDIGVEGFWNDMNEIATWGNALPENIVFDFDGSPATTRKGRNVYGLQMARSTYEGTRKLLKKRPFNLTRSGFAGIQRYAAVWTGDNVSYDEHMMLGVRMINSMGLSGIAFAGYDVGGFVGDANTKLFARWLSIGALSPFFRAHTMINTRDSEPWSYGEEVEQISRNYIRFRYQLMPYLYSLFYEASQTGMPVQQSLAIEHAHDDRVFDHQFHHQYLFGPFILVAPVESGKELTKVFLPAGNWYYVFTGEKFAGDRVITIDCPIHRLPIFVKAGAILPMEAANANTSVKPDTLRLHVYQGGEASFELYQDDGVTFEYEDGQACLRTISFSAAQKTIRLSGGHGKFQSNYASVQLVLHGFERINRVVINGEAHQSRETNFSYFTPLEKYDPINDPESMGEEFVQTASFPYSNEELEIVLN